jgi:predicted TIM-barrel fold metal-dependent hydrolase
MNAERIALVDVHAHFVTARYVEAASAAGHLLPDNMPGWPQWSESRQLELMARAGIGRAILSLSSPGVHFGDDGAARALCREVNEYAAEVVREHPTYFDQFAALPLPDVDGALDEAVHALEVLGATGLAVETNAQGIYLGDARLEPLWQELNARSAVVFVHPTAPPHAAAVASGRPYPLVEFLFDSARAAMDLVLRGVTTRYPRIEWIFTHGGGVLPLLMDRIDLFTATFGGSGLSSVPVTGHLRRFWFDMAGTPFPRQVPALVDMVGAGRLLYGSDYCFTPSEAVLAQIRSLDTAPQPAPDTWRSLTSRNALRLLG